MNGLGLEFLKSSGLSISELSSREMVLKTVCVESSESMRGELVVNEGKGEEVRSEREMREE